MTREEVRKAIMDGLWPILGGNHTDASVWQEISDVISAAFATPTAPDQAVVVRRRKPQDSSRWPHSFTAEAIEDLIDEVCGCAGKWDCQCTLVHRVCSEAWGFHNSQKWNSDDLVVDASRRKALRRAQGEPK